MKNSIHVRSDEKGFVLVDFLRHYLILTKRRIVNMKNRSSFKSVLSLLVAGIAVLTCHSMSDTEEAAKEVDKGNIIDQLAAKRGYKFEDFQRVAFLNFAMNLFCETYGEAPGKDGMITEEIWSELIGSSKAKKNTKKLNFLKESGYDKENRFKDQTRFDRWKNPYKFETKKGENGKVEVILYSAGPNGKYGDGDDVVQAGPRRVFE